MPRIKTSRNFVVFSSSSNGSAEFINTLKAKFNKVVEVKNIIIQNKQEHLLSVRMAQKEISVLELELPEDVIFISL